ncbi:MAG TPA: aminotransferase class III-fold pyridoxal phosphate-dependent enzyme [Dongiaceae bacterium]
MNIPARRNEPEYQWLPMTRPAALRPPVVIARGDGLHVEDVEGRRYLDGRGGIVNVNVGHNRPEVQDAIRRQLDAIAYYPSFDGSATPPSIALASRLIGMTAQEDMARVMFGSGGSDAVETALKPARQYWLLAGAPRRTKFISLRNAYHGMHFGGASLNGNAVFRSSYEPLLPGCFQVETPWLYRNPFTSDPKELGEICANLLEREILHQGPDTVAAFIAEPMQGAGGYIVPPENYWPLVRQVCDRHGVLLIADEVITGFGRLGSMFGSRLWGVKPDIMCFAKGLTSGYVPLGATLINARMATAWDQADHPNGAVMHGYSYSGHPLACAAAMAVLDITEREDLPANAARHGPHLLEALKPFAERFPIVGDVRGKGLLVCLELVRDRKTREPADEDLAYRLADATRAAGILVRPGGNKIAISPPLTIGAREIDAIVAALQSAFERVTP